MSTLDPPYNLDVLEAFDALPPADKHLAAVEILRQALPDAGDLPQAALVEGAEELFLTLGAEEELAAIQEALDDVAKGDRGIPLAEFDREFREQNHLPAKS